MGQVTKSYCAQADVENAMGIKAADTNVTAAIILDAILNASEEVDLITATKFHSEEDSGTAASGTTLTLVDSTKSWTVNQYEDYVLWIYGGTGSGQYARISSNTDTTLTLSSSDELATAPDTDSTYRIIPDVIKSESYDGEDTESFYLPYYPIVKLMSLTINATTVTPAKVYTYKNTGELKLNSKLSPEVSYFSDIYPQCNVIKWVYGVYPINKDVERLTAVLAAIRCLVVQTGGTYETLSTFGVPHVTGTIGQGYINIRETIMQLYSEANTLIKRLRHKTPIIV